MKTLKTLLQEITAGIKAWANASFSSGTHVHGNIANNGKLATASKVVISDSNKNITTSNVSDTELGYLSGVTSAIQTQISSKAYDADVMHTTGNETIAGTKTFASEINGTSSKAVADEDGNNIKSTYGKLTGTQTWTGTNTYNGMMVLQSSYDVEEHFRQKLPKDVSTSTDPLARFNTLVDSAGHNVVVTAEGHWETYVSKSVSLKYKNDSTKAGTLDFRLGSNGKGIFYPQSPFECSLGNCTNQWSSVYAQNYYYKSSDLEIGVQPAGNNTATTFWLDKNDNNLGHTRFVEYYNGIQTYEIYVRNLASNGALNPNGSQIAGGLQLALFPSTASSSVVANTSNVIPGATNTTDLGSSTNQWRHLHVQNTHTDLVEPTTSNTSLLLRATDNTWENGSRIFLYSNTAPNQTYGTIYIDVDHGDENHTKTALLLTPNEFVPGGGGTTGVSLGSSTHQWTKIYGQTYYYNGVAWGLDKANTWTGTNNYNQSLAYTDTVIVDKTIPSAYRAVDTFKHIGSDGAYWGGLKHNWLTDGYSRLQICVANHVLNNGTWSQGFWAVNFAASKDFSDIRFYPSNNNVINLGSSSYQWNKTYTNKLYLNGTEFGLGTANVWTLDNQFNGSNMIFKNGLKEIGSANSAGHYTLHFRDKNNNEMGYVSHQTEFLRIGCQNKFTNGVLDPEGTTYANYIDIAVKNDSTRYVSFISDTLPGVNNAYDLGNSTYKWKTLNGINPGALSLPQGGYSTAISVDITEWYVQDPTYPNDPTELFLDGTEHTVTTSVPGWVRVTFPNVTGNYAYARQFQAGANMAGEKIATGISDLTTLNFIFPIHDRLVVKIKAKSASVTIYPCLGNV